MPRQSRLHELQQQARLRVSEREQGLGMLQDIPSNVLQVAKLLSTSAVSCNAAGVSSIVPPGVLIGLWHAGPDTRYWHDSLPSCCRGLMGGCLHTCCPTEVQSFSGYHSLKRLLSISPAPDSGNALCTSHVACQPWVKCMYAPQHQDDKQNSQERWMPICWMHAGRG